MTVNTDNYDNWTPKEHLEACVRDSIGSIFGYDRDDDEEFDRDALDSLMESDKVTNEEIIQWFREELEKEYPSGNNR